MSLFKCIHKCLFRGVSIRKDTVIDISESEADMSVVKSSFVRVESEPIKVEKPGALNDFTREQYMQKLDALGVHYKVRASLADLKELYGLAVDPASADKQEAKA